MYYRAIIIYRCDNVYHVIKYLKYSTVLYHRFDSIISQNKLMPLLSCLL